MVEKLDFKGFKDRVVVKRENCVVKFYSIMCPLCVALAPVYEEIAASYSDNLKFYKVDVDAEKNISKAMKFEGVPTLFLFHDGSYEEIPYPYDNPDSLTGYHKEGIISFIKEKVKLP